MFSTQAMRLRREQWANATLLAEELFTIFRSTVPLSHNAPVTITSNNGQAPLTLRNFGSGDFVLNLENANGNTGTISVGPNGTEIDGETVGETAQNTQTSSVQRVFAGKVVSATSPTSYKMNLYPDGPGNSPIMSGGSAVEFDVTQLKADGTDTVPVDTWDIVVLLGDGNYYVQFPTFMG